MALRAGLAGRCERLAHQNLNAARGEVGQQQRRGLRHARVREAADERTDTNGKGHAGARTTLQPEGKRRQPL